MAGIDQSGVSRWKKGERPKPENVIRFARSADRPVLEALVVAGLITAEEASERPSAIPSLADFSERQILREMQRRLELREFAEEILGEVPERDALLAMLSDASLTEISQALGRRMDELQKQIEQEGGSDAGQVEAQKSDDDEGQAGAGGPVGPPPPPPAPKSIGDYKRERMLRDAMPAEHAAHDESRDE